MPGTISFTGPEPPPGQQFCTVCAATRRQAAMTELKPLIDSAVAADRNVTTFDLRHCKAFGVEIPLAVAHGLFAPMASPPMGNGLMPLPVPLCWTHLLGLSLQESAVMPAHPGMMPGTGPGGAVHLDRR